MNKENFFVQIGNKKVGPSEPIFIVAEIGINHNGDLELAKKLIDVAVNVGCDAVKFQKRTIDVVYTPEELARPRENPFGPTNGDLKRGLEFGQKEYEEINQYCRKKEILWFASCWDRESVDFIDEFDPPCYKIASPRLTDDDLLKYTRSKGKPIVLSTGMSTMRQIEHAVNILGKKDLIILHCVSTYPSENKEVNLKMIDTLSKKFPRIPIGYSGHERGVSISVMARVLGAALIERHITLDRTMWGSDQAASIEPKGLQLLIRDIGIFEDAKGDGIKKVLDSEVPIMNKLRRKK